MPDRASVRQVPEPRPDLLTFEISGKLTSRDMERMAATVDQAFDRHDQIDMLILFTRFEGATAGAAFELHALKVEAASILHVRRYAVVGAPAVAEAMITLGGALSPVEAKTFDDGDEAQARAWIDRP